MMIRHIGLWGVLFILVVGTVLKTNLEARQREDKLSRIEAEIDAEKARIRVLTAEWASLNSPERLQKLATRHLELAPAETLQIALASDVPEKLAAPEAPPVDVAATPVKEQVAEVRVADAAATAPTATPDKVAALITATPPAKPAVKPVSKPVLKLAQAEKVRPAVRAAPVQDDMISQLIEREAPQNLLWASYRDSQ